MRTFRGVNLRLVSPEMLHIIRPLSEWMRPASRAFSRSIQRTNNPTAVIQTPADTPPNPNPVTMFLDSQFRLENATTNSKQLGFNCSAIPASTTILLTSPAFAGTMLVAPVAGANGQWLQQVAGIPTWSTLPTTTNVLLDGSNHTDTVTGVALARGQLIVANSTPKWDKLAIGASGTFLRSNATDPSWQTLVAADLPTHDHTKHTDRTRTQFISASDMTDTQGTLLLLFRGTFPNRYHGWKFDSAPIATQGVGFYWRVPKDYVAGTNLNIEAELAGDAFDDNDFIMKLHWKAVTAGSSLVAAESTAVSFTAAIITVDNLEPGMFPAISSGVVADAIMRFSIERDYANAGDTAAAAIFLIGVTVSYTADM